jgi:hypothetical protein
MKAGYTIERLKQPIEKYDCMRVFNFSKINTYGEYPCCFKKNRFLLQSKYKKLSRSMEDKRMTETKLNIIATLLGITLLGKVLVYWIQNPHLTEMQVIFQQWYYIAIYAVVMIAYWLTARK